MLKNIFKNAALTAFLKPAQREFRQRATALGRIARNLTVIGSSLLLLSACAASLSINNNGSVKEYYAGTQGVGVNCYQQTPSQTADSSDDRFEERNGFLVPKDYDGPIYGERFYGSSYSTGLSGGYELMEIELKPFGEKHDRHRHYGRGSRHHHRHYNFP